MRNKRYLLLILSRVWDPYKIHFKHQFLLFFYLIHVHSFILVVIHIYTFFTFQLSKYSYPKLSSTIKLLKNNEFLILVARSIFAGFFTASAASWSALRSRVRFLVRILEDFTFVVFLRPRTLKVGSFLVGGVDIRCSCDKKIFVKFYYACAVRKLRYQWQRR